MSYLSTSTDSPSYDAQVASLASCAIPSPPSEPPLESPLFEILKVADSVRADGEHLLGLHLRSRDLKNTEDQPITCALYPRGGAHNGYTREVSTQLGCIIGCDFCGCGRFGGSLSPDEVVEQIRLLTLLAASKRVPLSAPLKTSFTDGGEIILNRRCMEILEVMRETPRLPMKISTVFPDLPRARRHLDQILERIREQGLNVLIQISLYSTDETQRQASSRCGVRLSSDQKIRELGQRYLDARSDHRKATLSFTLKDDSHCVPAEIREILPPELFMIRLHPYKRNHVQPPITPMSDVECAALQTEFERLGYKVVRDRYDPIEKGWLNLSGTRALTPPPTPPSDSLPTPPL